MIPYTYKLAPWLLAPPPEVDQSAIGVRLRTAPSSEPMPAHGDTSVYVHFPWCLKKCPYCDFASRRIERAEVPHGAYADALVRELEGRAPSLGGRRLVSVFFGGGTPSLWEPRELGRVLAAIRGAFSATAEDLEVTVECNPSSLTQAGARALCEAGVGRLSIGVQSLDDGRLGFLGRKHDAAEALAAVRGAVAELPRVSADLMFAMAEQSVDGFLADVERLLALGVRHLSAYALTIEPGTLFGELHRRGRLPLVHEDDGAAMFEQAEEALGARGFTHYEVSNYAVPGEEARHNQHYWRGGAYLGLGAAAVGCLDEGPGAARRWRNQTEPARYTATAGDRDVEEWEEHLGPQEIVREALMLGLRTREGADLDDTGRRAGVDPRAGREEALERRLERGDVILDGTHLRVPSDRWLHLDGIVADLF